MPLPVIPAYAILRCSTVSSAAYTCKGPQHLQSPIYNSLDAVRSAFRMAAKHSRIGRGGGGAIYGLTIVWSHLVYIRVPTCCMSWPTCLLVVDCCFQISDTCSLLVILSESDRCSSLNRGNTLHQISLMVVMTHGPMMFEALSSSTRISTFTRYMQHYSTSFSTLALLM